ncbi:MAG TPA: aquaporin [Pseudobdellovibrionaceae bacterium]|nr:aquaporin [Pseudobdellovibrionaceae bacterium]
MSRDFQRALVAEFLGTAALLMIVVGSGLMADQLFTATSEVVTGLQNGLKLLANSMATGAGLFVLIQSLAPISGAHFNPLVSALALWNKQITLRRFFGNLMAQFSGAVSGVAITHLMFARPWLEASSRSRSSPGLWISECVASAGLLAVITLNASKSLAAQAGNIALWITAAYWFTASTSFANPAVTLARSFTESFTGIAGSDVAGFCFAQLSGLLIVLGVLKWLRAAPQSRSDESSQSLK